MKKYPLAIVACIAILSGCASTDPYTGEKKTSNTAKGVGIGAVAGAVIGGVTSSKNDRKKGILTGAAAGAAIGGGVGVYMDKQETKLREQLQGTGVQVRREGDEIFLVMPGNITFETGKSNVRSQFYPVLESVALVLKEFDQTIVDASGHTDSTGGSDLNQRLSEDRAEAVKRVLVEQGVRSGRIRAVGYGYRRPVADNGTAAGREQNRRVELKLEAIEQ